MSKSAEAFRTIGEVAEELDVPKHVLRFWEGKFPHIRPMKRGGGRRYYRPEDMELLRGIRYLLHAEGYTIKGVQKILREQGVDQVKAAAAASVAAVASGKRGAKARGRGGKPSVDAVQSLIAAAGSGAITTTAAPAVAADAGHGAINADEVSGPRTAAGATSKPKPVAASSKAIIAAAIAELEHCRKLLASHTPISASEAALPARAARS